MTFNRDASIVRQIGNKSTTMMAHYTFPIHITAGDTHLHSDVIFFVAAGNDTEPPLLSYINNNAHNYASMARKASSWRLFNRYLWPSLSRSRPGVNSRRREAYSLGMIDFICSHTHKLLTVTTSWLR